MHAIGYTQTGPIDRDDALIDIDVLRPIPADRDILVEVRAVSLNPVDTKVRKRDQPAAGEWRVLGWDASGTVVETGPDATLFRAGDKVYYAGTIVRPGTNSQFHLVDERIVGSKPKSLDWAAAAALPLTSITAWEAMLDRLDVSRPVPGAAKAILIIGGAGGVGSVAIQIARAMTDLTVIATASRQETRAWVTEMGAHHVVDHSRPLAPQIAELGIGAPSFVLSTTQTDSHAEDIAELIAPQGRFALIDDPVALNVALFKRKSVSIHMELMFTRSVYGTVDMAEQGKLLNEVARMVDAGAIRTTMTERLSPINAANLRRAHAMSESGATRGKIVLEGFDTAGRQPVHAV